MEISIRDLAGNIADVTAFRGKIRWDTTKPNGQPRRCLDVSRAQREFGFRARTELNAGLRATIDWYVKNRQPAPQPVVPAAADPPQDQPRGTSSGAKAAARGSGRGANRARPASRHDASR